MKEFNVNVPDAMAQEFEQKLAEMQQYFGGKLKIGDYIRALDESLPITERVKTFDDACLLAEGKTAAEWLAENETSKMESHVLAYLKLCVVAKALRNGWKPVFDGVTPRYFPWFSIWTKDEIADMDDSDKKEWRLVPLPAGVGYACRGSNLGVSVLYSFDVVSYSHPTCGGALASEKSEIARHFGAAFLDIWVDYITGNSQPAVWEQEVGCK